MLEGGVAGLPGQPALWLVEITASPAPERAPYPLREQTVRDKAPKLRVAITPVQVNNCKVNFKNFLNNFETVDGSWGGWEDWGACSKKCGPGNQTRTRSCNNPTPAHGGSECTGKDSETQGLCTFIPNSII